MSTYLIFLIQGIWIMRLYRHLNENYFNFISSICKSFNNDTTCGADVRRIMQELKEEKDDSTDKYYRNICQLDQYAPRLQSMELTLFDDRIDVPFLNDIKIQHIWSRCQQSEKKIILAYLNDMYKIRCVIGACGDNLQRMETLAGEFLSSSDTKSGNIQQTMFSKLLQGGSMAQELVQMYSNKQDLTNMLDQFKRVMGKQSSGEVNTLLDTIRSDITDDRLSDDTIQTEMSKLCDPSSKEHGELQRIYENLQGASDIHSIISSLI